MADNMETAGNGTSGEAVEYTGENVTTSPENRREDTEKKSGWRRTLGAAALGAALTATSLLPWIASRNGIESDSSDWAKRITDVMHFDNGPSGGLDVERPDPICETYYDENNSITVRDYQFAKPIVGALQLVGNDPDERLWADALHTPMKEKSLDEVIETICTDPFYGATVAHLFANAEFEVNDQTILEMNEEWLADFAVPTDEINEIAALYLPGLGKSEAWIKENESKVFIAGIKYKEFADHLATLISRSFREEGVSTVRTNESYHLADGGKLDSETGLPEVEISHDAYTSKSLIAVFKEKDGTCFIEFRTNEGDKRNSLVHCDTPTSTQTTKVRPTTPPTTHPPETTSTTQPMESTTTTTTQPEEETTTTTPGASGKDSGSGSKDVVVPITPDHERGDDEVVVEDEETLPDTDQEEEDTSDSGEGATDVEPSPPTTAPPDTLPEEDQDDAVDGETAIP